MGKTKCLINSISISCHLCFSFEWYIIIVHVFEMFIWNVLSLLCIIFIRICGFKAKDIYFFLFLLCSIFIRIWCFNSKAFSLIRAHNNSRNKHLQSQSHSCWIGPLKARWRMAGPLLMQNQGLSDCRSNHKLCRSKPLAPSVA